MANVAQRVIARSPEAPGHLPDTELRGKMRAMTARDLRVRDLMTPDVATLGRNDSLSLADDVMRLGRIRHMPVLDDDGETLCGVVSQRDLFRGALASALGYGERAQTKMLSSLVVKEVMATDPVAIGPDASARDAAEIMLARKVGCLPVVDEGKLVGILTESDFVKLALRD